MTELPPSRTGANRRSAIPSRLLTAMNKGEAESITLVEWLAIDQGKVAQAVLPQIGFSEDETAAVVAGHKDIRNAGIMLKTRTMAASIHRILAARPTNQREPLWERVAGWPGSDVVREWGALAVTEDIGLSMERRWELARRFAVDSNMNVREIAWLSLRPYTMSDLQEAIRLFKPWAIDGHEGMRRCAIEGTRPRGVWCFHHPVLKKDPSPALALLDKVKSDPSRYVRNAVGNWLNDASKSRPDWVRALCSAWKTMSPTPETAYIVKRGLRTLKKT